MGTKFQVDYRTHEAQSAASLRTTTHTPRQQAFGLSPGNMSITEFQVLIFECLQRGQDPRRPLNLRYTRQRTATQQRIATHSSAGLQGYIYAFLVCERRSGHLQRDKNRRVEVPFGVNENDFWRRKMAMFPQFGATLGAPAAGGTAVSLTD